MKIVNNPSSGYHRRQGTNYLLLPEEIQQYKRPRLSCFAGTFCQRKKWHSLITGSIILLWAKNQIWVRISAT